MSIGTSTQCSGKVAIARRRTSRSFHMLDTSSQAAYIARPCPNLGEPACPEVVNQRPILSHIGHSPHSYCVLTGLTKPWPIMQRYGSRLSGAISVVAMVAVVAKYYRGQVVVLPTPCTWPVVKWWCGLSKQGSFTPAKGLPQTTGKTGDWISHACGLIY